MAEELAPTPTVPPTPTPSPEPPPTPPAPAKTADPFAALKPEPSKSAAAAPKPGDEPKGKEVEPAPVGDKKTAVRKNPLEEQRHRIEQQNKTIESVTRERDQFKRDAEELRTKGGGDTSALAKTLESRDKEIERLRGELAAQNYSKHPDFQSKYEKPFNDAANRAKDIIESLEVTEKDAEGNEKNRPANWKQDFGIIFRMPRAGARARAKELFPDANDVATVMNQYDRLHELDEAKTQALTEWQTGASEREQRERAQKLVQQQKVGQAFEATTNDFIEADQEFQIKPDDTESKSLWDKSQAIVDEIFFNRAKHSPEELVILDSAVRLRAINEPVLRARLAKVQAELEDYKARLEGKEASANGKTRRTAPPANQPEETTDMKADLLKTLKDAG